jgi:hypothetical protein
MSDGPTLGNFFANLGFNLRGVGLVEGAVKAVERLNAAVEQRTKVQDALTEIYGDKNKAAALIGISADEGAIAADRATKRTERWGQVMLALNQTLEVGIKLYRGVEGAFRSVSNAVQEAADQAGQAVDLSARLGISASAVQELGYAASQSGSDLEELSQGLTGLSNKVDAAKKGSKDAAASLRAVGVSLVDVRSGRQSLDGTLGQIAEAFAKMPDGAKKSALAVDVFGKAGVKLIPLLNEGSDGIDALRNKARDLGIVIDDEAAKSLEGFGDDTDTLKQQLTGLRNQAIVAILPALQSMVSGMQAWISANRETLVSLLTGALQVFVGVLQVAGKAVEGVVAVFGWLSDHVDLVIAALAGLAAAMLPVIIEFIVLKVAAIAAAAAATAAWIAAAAPFVLIGLAVGAVVFALLRFRAQAGRAIAWVGDRFQDLWRGIKELGGGIAGFFASVGSSIAGIGGRVADFFGAIGGAIKSALGAVFAWFEDKYNWLKGKAEWVIDKLKAAKNLVGDAVDAVLPTKSDNLTGAAAAWVRDQRAASGSKAVSMTNNVTINAPGADANQVAAIFEERKNMWLREADASIA